jgi:hypothetical protein
MKSNRLPTVEKLRLAEDTAREKNRKRWGPYLSERQWATASCRLSSIFLPDEHGRRPCHGDVKEYSSDPHWRDLLFHEYFHGETGRGLGASHQTAWTALAARALENAVENSAINRKANSDELMTSRLPKHIPTRHFRVPGEVNDASTAL